MTWTLAQKPVGPAKIAMFVVGPLLNLGFRRFSMRGLPRANGEWAFQNTVTNLLKIHATGWTPAR